MARSRNQRSKNPAPATRDATLAAIKKRRELQDTRRIEAEFNTLTKSINKLGRYFKVSETESDFLDEQAREMRKMIKKLEAEKREIQSTVERQAACIKELKGQLRSVKDEMKE